MKQFLPPVVLLEVIRIIVVPKYDEEESVCMHTCAIEFWN
jgi:hypothetical protein